MQQDKKVMKSMAQKRSRHYGETKSLCAIVAMLVGVVTGVVLTLLWPQSFIVTTFNSRLMYQLVLSSDDYYACNDKFKAFVIDEPDQDYAMLSFYVFSVTNPGQVIQQGYKPDLTELGPYSYVKRTYRYDVYFSDDDTEVTYKEYSFVEPVSDNQECEAMFFRMERQGTGLDPCGNDACICKDPNTMVTIVNPLFLKSVWQDTPFRLLSQFSVDVFIEIKRLLDEPFTEAVQAHLVSKGLREVYQFRTQFQLGKILNTAYTQLRRNYTDTEIAETSIAVSNCGLDQYGISSCPFILYNTYRTTQTLNATSIGGYPSLVPFLNTSSDISFLNLETGFPAWLGITWAQGEVTVNSNDGYTMITSAEAQEKYEEIRESYVLQVYSQSYDSLSSLRQQAVDAAMSAIARFIGFVWLQPYYTMSTVLQLLAYDEFRSTYAPVICSPMGVMCVWQYGYMTQFHNSTFSMSRTVAAALIDLTQEVNTNPISLYVDAAAPSWYNAHLYCTKVYAADDDFNIDCTNYGDTIFDGITGQPAGLWGSDTGVSAVNRTFLYSKYGPVSQTVKNSYFFLSCNVSYMMHNIYRTETAFHDEFVVRYLNKFKDPAFSHNFTVGNWTELGLAQWAGGFVTHALVQVRTTKQLVRNGMWNFGQDRYYINFLEFASWCVRQGFPYFWIYSIDDAKLLLDALSRNDSIGVDFRQHIFYTGSTFIGDNVNYVNSLGDIGETTFTPEANRGNFSCTGELQAACTILNEFVDSSSTQCSYVNSLYDTCYRNYLFLQNRWINFDYCSDFETSISNPSTGIPCDSGQVYGNLHPYTKSRGNVVFQMLYSLTYSTNLLYGLWCREPSNCGFNFGGMFVNTTVQHLLFEGFSDASYVYFLEKEFKTTGLDFECVEAPFDVCGVKNYRCSNQGLYMILPQTKELYHIAYNVTPHEEYFTPYYVITHEGDMLWPFASNSTLAAQSQATMDALPVQNYSIVPNPYWSSYPAWDTNQTAFLKYYQCTKRMYSGPPGLFASCEQSLYTGMDGNEEHVLRLLRFYGNSTAQAYDVTFASNFSAESPNGITVNGSVVQNQLPPYYWSGFISYPYSYIGLTQGVNYSRMANPIVFNKDTVMSLTLAQTPLIFGYQRAFPVTIPLPVGTADVEEKSSNPAYLPANVRRFVEWSSSWQPYRTLAVPKDSYGMRYTIPIGMATLQRYAGFPMFVDTPKSYGNALWGGIEYSMVSGTTRTASAERSYVDYDPVTGRAIRSAMRQQLTLRIEASAIFPIFSSSQSRCIAPTKTYATSSGYGCFGYVPLLWYEDARTMDRKTYFRWYDHFYTRPDRGNVLTLAGIVTASLLCLLGFCVYVNEAYQRRKFMSRVYID